MILRKKQRRLS